ncbi:hypothetical protein WKH57_00855 [Niallia taxi]|uniref:hypothetical protein n=1 Tax=Niallia taxi TaxID=2499688 RepID=UPI00317AC927
MSKKLTLSTIKESNKKYSQKKRIDLPDGNHVFIYPDFSPTKTVEFVRELLMEYLNKEDNGLSKTKIDLNSWTVLSLLYKFADLGIPSDTKKKILAFNELLEYEYTPLIIGGFTTESINKLKATMDNIVKNIDLLAKEQNLNDSDLIEQVIKTETEKELAE